MSRPVEKYEKTYHGTPLERFRRFYRGTTFQAIILGLVSFTQPGIWVALNSESRKIAQSDRYTN